jgi:hypothetical protein
MRKGTGLGTIARTFSGLIAKGSEMRKNGAEATVAFSNRRVESYATTHRAMLRRRF